MFSEKEYHPNQSTTDLRWPDSRESVLQIRANRLILANCFRVPEPIPFFFFCESRIGGLKLANRRFEAIRTNRSHVMKMFFL